MASTGDLFKGRGDCRCAGWAWRARGLTTFSIFSLEALVLLSAGAFGEALLYIAASVAAWLAAVWLGFRCGSALNG